MVSQYRVVFHEFTYSVFTEVWYMLCIVLSLVESWWINEQGLSFYEAEVFMEEIENSAVGKRDWVEHDWVGPVAL